MRTKLVLTAIALFGFGAPQTKADAVLDWNQITVNSILVPGARQAASGILDLAVVHAAIHDVVQAYQKRFESYAVEIANAQGSMDAAIAKAAHDVLVNRFPAQSANLDNIYAAYVPNPADPDVAAGVAVGQQVAAAVIALRATDGSFPPVFTDIAGANLPGVWRPTESYINTLPPPDFAHMAIPWVADVTPFALLSPTQLRPGPPPALTSTQYRKDYDEVKALGRDTSTARSAEQTELARFWSDNFITQWNRALRSISADYLSDSGDIARLFALAWMASGDGFISVWDTKRHFLYWRPVTAVQEGQNDGNPKTVGDPQWKPFINTPNYPDYSSGANGLTGAITRTLRLFFHGQHLTFTVTSLSPFNPAQPSRNYTRIDDAADEVVEARILQGIHFRTADLVGREQGREAAKWAYKHILRPLRGHDEGDED